MDRYTVKAEQVFIVHADSADHAREMVMLAAREEGIKLQIKSVKYSPMSSQLLVLLPGDGADDED